VRGGWDVWRRSVDVCAIPTDAVTLVLPLRSAGEGEGSAVSLGERGVDD